MTQKTPSSKKAKGMKQAFVGNTAAIALAMKHQEAEGSFPDERQRMIAEAAYLIAEQRNFQGDLAFDDWLQAEAEIDALFSDQH